MSKTYVHLTEAERELIATMHWEGKGPSEIARTIGRDKGTISRELRRNASADYSCYTPCQAHKRSAQRKLTARHSRPLLKNKKIQQYVRQKMKLGWSPEIIAGRLKKNGQSISHEAIYQFIYHRDTPDREQLISQLCRAHRKRRIKGKGRKVRKTKIPNRVSIAARPKAVDQRKQVGHWEGDTLISRKSKAALHSMTERVTRLLRLSKLESKSAAESNKAVAKALKNLPAKAKRTLTLDNGTENASHEELTEALGIKCYFADPYAAWQRGSNEQINGLIRRYLPKGTDFSKIDKDQIKKIEKLLNNRPRKCLRFKTPLEVARSIVALQS
ncbi:MAG TPA: IS30 family transposase [Nitrospirota bacterium]|nr:IS30 family transposase [Nitrospirota bacterium]